MNIERAKQYDAIINDLPYGKIGELVSQSETHFLKVHEVKQQIAGETKMLHVKNFRIKPGTTLINLKISQIIK